MREQNRRHRAERQPESRRHDRPRIDQQHEPSAHASTTERATLRPLTNASATTARHPQRALRRHIEAGQRGMQRGEQRAAVTATTSARAAATASCGRSTRNAARPRPPATPRGPRRSRYASPKSPPDDSCRCARISSQSAALTSSCAPIASATTIPRCGASGKHRIDPRAQRGAPAVHAHADAARVAGKRTA